MDLQGISREQKELGAAVCMLLFIISLVLKWQTFGPISGSGADLGSWPLALLIALAAGGIMAAGARGYLSKPVSVMKFLEAVRGIIG